MLNISEHVNIIILKLQRTYEQIGYLYQKLWSGPLSMQWQAHLADRDFLRQQRRYLRSRYNRLAVAYLVYLVPVMKPCQSERQDKHSLREAFVTSTRSTFCLLFLDWISIVLSHCISLRNCPSSSSTCLCIVLLYVALDWLICCAHNAYTFTQIRQAIPYPAKWKTICQSTSSRLRLIALCSKQLYLSDPRMVLILSTVDLTLW